MGETRASRPRGYFGIGAEGVSKSANVGALLRTAHAFGASFCFTIGTGWDARQGRRADTADTPQHVPLWRFPVLEDLRLPRGWELPVSPRAAVAEPPATRRGGPHESGLVIPAASNLTATVQEGTWSNAHSVPMGDDWTRGRHSGSG